MSPVSVEWDQKELRLTALDLDKAMEEEDPPIFLRDTHYYDYYTNKEWRLIDTFFLRSPEEKIIAERMKKVFNKSIGRFNE